MENFYPYEFVYLKLALRDAEDEDPTAYFKEAFRFIDDARTNNGRCLVHCVAGASHDRGVGSIECACRNARNQLYVTGSS